MIRIKALALLLGAFLLFSPTANAADGLKIKPGEFVGTAEQCGGTAGVDTVDGSWVAGEGVADGEKGRHALYLQKLGPTSNCAAGGAVVEGVEGMTITELGFDYRTDGHCGGGAPRFNLYTDTGTLFFGCNSGTQTPTDDPEWVRVRIAVPSVEVNAIQIIFDEGEDVGDGFVYLDNIDINGTLIGKPGNV